MKWRTVQLIDPNHRIVGTACVTEADGLFRGDVDLTAMPPSVRRAFEQYEEIVSHQNFSLLDEIEDEVDRMGIQAEFNEPTASASAVDDLQVYPRTGRISFRLRGQQAPPVEPPTLAQDRNGQTVSHHQRP